MRILFVEQHELFVQVVTKEFLYDQDITRVASAQEAWQELSAGQYDAVLVAYDLVDGKGDELVMSIRGNELEVKVIAASSHPKGNTALQDAGADAVCGKLQFSRIREVLESLCL